MDSNPLKNEHTPGPSMSRYHSCLFNTETEY